MLRKFRSLTVEDIELNKVQGNIEAVLNPILSNPSLDFHIEKSVQLAIGDNLVNHKLGRPPLGWYVVRQRGAANLYDKQDSNQTPKVNFIINSDAVVSVDIYFF